MHSLGAETFSHPALGAGSVVVVGLVVAGVVGAAVVVAASVDGATTASVLGKLGGVVDDVGELSEHAANTPSRTTAIAATRLKN